jgi:hypothetical protein
MSEWISIDASWPDDHQDILVYYYGRRNNFNTPIVRFMKQSSYCDEVFDCEEEVTHWMPLPEPPKEKE